MDTAVTDAQSLTGSGLRPMDPSRDLGAIADLVGSAFAHELDDRGRAALRELRWMSRLSPLVWWWSRTDPSFSDAFNGLVWEEPKSGKGRRIVGNVSLNRAPGKRPVWIVCNVVVEERLRGQGIGRRLTEAAVAQAEELGAEEILLQVYQDNLTALRLYNSLGFQETAGEVALEAPGPQVKDLFSRGVSPLAAPGYTWQGCRGADGQAAYELACAAIPGVLQWLRPVKAHDFRFDGAARLGEQLSGLLTGRMVRRFSLRKGGRMAALLTVVAASSSGERRIELLVEPAERGHVEDALVSRALSMLEALPPASIRVVVGKEHSAAIRSLHRYGFVERKTLLTLRRMV